MHEQLVEMLVVSGNEAADDVLLEGLRLGVEVEQSLILNALLERKSLRGLMGVVEQFDQLPPRLQNQILKNVKFFHQALRECGRSERMEPRLAAMKVISLSHQGKLAYVVSENLHLPDEQVSRAAVEAMVVLARWVAISTRQLQAGTTTAEPQADGTEIGDTLADQAALYRDVIEQRGEMETVLARTLDVHRGRHGAELLRAGLLLCDWPGSKTLAILQSSKHGGQTAMVRRLQQPPSAEHVPAFLLGATQGQLRVHFGTVFSHINEPAVLDALLFKTHWLKDHPLELSMRQVTRGIWWQESEMLRDIQRRPAAEASRVGEWLGVSGMHDMMQDERLWRLAEFASDDPAARLRLLRIAILRRKGGSTQFLRRMLQDPDERIVRMAARELIRRRPPDVENTLIQLMTNAPDSVRLVVGRALGQSGFENYWKRFDRLDKPTRQQAGRAMLKLLPDAVQRLGRRLAGGPVEQRIKAMQIAQELGVAEPLRDQLVALLNHPHPKVRSKAVSVLGELPSTAIEPLLERVLDDTDARVRANAIEALESRPGGQFLPKLARRAKSGHNRERANAIKALHSMKIGNIAPQLLSMLRDERPEHRISGLWALRHMGFWKLLNEVGELARSDTSPRVRRYAIAMLRGVAEMVRSAKELVG